MSVTLTLISGYPANTPVFAACRTPYSRWKIADRRLLFTSPLAADAGSVSGRDVGGYLNVETQAGQVRLEVTELLPGEHRVRATMGEVRLQLAPGLDVCIEAHTSLGSIRNDYPSRQSAPTKLQLSTEMGSVRIEQGGFNMSSRPRPRQPERPAAPVDRATDPELERILKMVEAGELSAQEADDLLQAMGKA